MEPNAEEPGDRGIVPVSSSAGGFGMSGPSLLQIMKGLVWEGRQW